MSLSVILMRLGTIAAVTPLLGLLGTVIGMIKVFTNITTVGVGNPADLAGGYLNCVGHHRERLDGRHSCAHVLSLFSRSGRWLSG